MRVTALKSLASIALALAGSSLAAEEGTTPEVVVETAVETQESPVAAEDVTAVEEPPVSEEEVVREPEQVQLPLLQPMREQQVQQPQKPEQPQGEKLLLAALRIDTLFEYMSEMQKRFFLAILPDSWAVPKFLPATNADLEQVQLFLREVSQNMGAASVPAALVELAESAQASAILQGYPHLPAVFRHLLSASTSTFQDIHKDINDTLVSIIPNLDSADLDMVAKLFRVPSELEFPVSPEGLSLFLPVVVRNVSSINVPSLPLPESGLKEVKASIKDVLVPVVDHQGELLFADAASVFQGIQLPQELPLKPLALFSALEVEDVNSLWSAVKAPVLSKLSLLGSDAPALFGPVMTLASLPRVALSINGESQQPAGTNQLAKIVGDVSSQLRKGLRSFDDLTFPEAIAPSTQALMREPLEEFLNLKFLNFAIPVVGVARDLEAGVFTPLKSLTLCTATDCPLGLSLPSFPEFLVSPEAAIAKLQERVEKLSLELQMAVIELQRKINSSLPQGVAAATDATGVSIDEALNTALSLTGTLQAAVNIASERVNKLFGVETAAEEAAAAAKTVMETLENPTGFFAAIYGKKQQEKPKADEEPGLLAPRRKLQSGLIDLPALARGIDLTRLEFPGQGSLEQLLSLRQLASAVEDFVVVDGSPLFSGLSPSNVGKSLGTLFRENQLPQSLLQQPLTSLLTDGSALPSSLLNLNLGQFLSLSSALDNIFSSPLTDIPNLADLALNPAALLSLTPGTQAVDRLFTAPKAAAQPTAATNGLFF